MPITISIPKEITASGTDATNFLSSAVTGPLSSLFGNEYVKTNYRYPADLGSNPARKHSIVFTVMEAKPQTPGDFASTSGDWANVATFEGGAFKDAKAGNLDAAQTKAGLAASSAASGLKPFTNVAVGRKAGSTIALYIPDNVNVSYASNYDSDVSLTSSLGKPYFLAQGAVSLYNAFKNQGDSKMNNIGSTIASDPYARELAAKALSNKVLGTDLTRLAANQLGLAQNPQLQVMFSGVGFRQFQFEFMFTPYSEAESAQVQKIIHEFKMASAPEITSNDIFNQGLFLKVPNTLQLEFYYGNQINKNVHKIGECVISGVDVDYAPNGWSTFNDGSPTQIKMTLQLQETVIVDKNRIANEGF